MILTRTPLRISFCGGGSDLPAFFREEPGYVVSAAIDRYVHIVVNRKFDAAIRVAYSQTENVASVQDLDHELVKAALRRYGPAAHIEIHSIADVPAGTGLGSSSSFTVGLIHALHAYQGIYITPAALASEAVGIELGDCNHPAGYQDQYIAAYGGLRAFTFTAGRVETERLDLNGEIIEALNRHLLLLHTGLPARDAGTILREQSRMDAATRERTRRLVGWARFFADALRDGDIEHCGEILDDAWQVKRAIAAGVSSAQIDGWYEAARRAGAWGGKLCGAGGGGFLLFLAPPETHAAIRQALRLRHVPIRIGVGGSEVVYAA